MDSKLSAALAAARAHQRALILALRQPPVHTDWEAERQAQAERRNGPVRAGWHTMNEPENRRYLSWGTLDGVRICGPYVTRYDGDASLGDACDRGINFARALTGEGYSDVLLSGNRKWFGPMG